MSEQDTMEVKYEDMERVLTERSISRSYPFYSIAQKHGVSYTTVLALADNHRESKLAGAMAVPFNQSQSNACEAGFYGLSEPVVEEMLMDINIAGKHFEAIQSGLIPAFPEAA